MSSTNKLRIIPRYVVIWTVLIFVCCFVRFTTNRISVDRTSATSYKETINASSTTMNAIFLEEHNKGRLSQDDNRIQNYIKKQGYLKPPPSVNLPYNLENPTIDPSMGQSQIVQKLFQGKRNGFFVECGALDGETRSNTLSLERDFSWEGLLVEADPKNYDLLISKHRKAWTAACCLSIHPYPHEVIFNQNFNIGKIKSENVEDVPESFRIRNPNQESSVRIQCLPLFSLLSYIGVKTVDYFSLDVEGFEMDVLYTIPFNLINITVLTVEFIHGRGGAEEIVDYMESKGYRVITKLTRNDYLANDIIFAHNTFPIQEEFPKLIQS